MSNRKDQQTEAKVQGEEMKSQDVKQNEFQEAPATESREAELLRSAELLAASNTPDVKKTPEELGQKELLSVKPLQYNVTDPEQQKAKAEKEEFSKPAENEIQEQRIDRQLQEHGLIKPEKSIHGTQELDMDGNAQRMTEKEIEIKSQQQEGVMPPLHKDSTVLRTDKIALAAREERARREEAQKKQDEPQVKQQKEKEEGQQKK